MSFLLSLGNAATATDNTKSLKFEKFLQNSDQGTQCPDESYFDNGPMDYNMNIYGYLVSYKISDIKDPICFAYRKQEGPEFLVGFLPKNQSLSNWNEMFSIIGSKDKYVPNKNFLEYLNRSTFCAGNKSIKTLRNNDDRLEVVSVCGSYSNNRLTNNKHISEITHYLMRRVGGNLYVFYSSKRGMPLNALEYNFNNNDIKKWSKFLNSIKIIKAKTT
jgi:hypothetical protein